MTCECITRYFAFNGGPDFRRLSNLGSFGKGEKYELKRRMERKPGDKCCDKETGYHPRALLPTEVWCSIFENVTSPQDWLSCFYSSSVFRTESWLHWKTARTVRLFPEVIKVYWEKFGRFQHTSCPSDLDEEDSDAESTHTTPLSPSTSALTFLLNCRGVCKTWRLAIDSLFLGPTLNPPMIHTNIVINRLQHRNFLPFLTSSLLPSIPPSWNPFPNRELTIFDEDDDFDLSDDLHGEAAYLLDFQVAISQFLAKFGHHLSVFSHYGREQQQYTGRLHWYSTIRGWITRMPNLEVLSLVYLRIDDFYEPVQELVEATQRYPFPSLAKLKTLHLEDTYVPVIHSAVQSNPQVDKIIINRHSCRLSWLTLGSIPLQNLTTLYIRIVSMEELLQLSLLTSPLEKLKVQMIVSFEEYEISKCFQVLERFRETLTFLDFSVPSCCQGRASLKLPWLKELSLRFALGRDVLLHCDMARDNEDEEPMQLLNLLSPLDSLEKVKITPFNLDVYKRFQEEEFVHVLNLEGDIGDWLVWPLWGQLPKLRQVQLEGITSKFLPACIHSFVYFRPDLI